MTAVIVELLAVYQTLRVVMVSDAAVSNVRESHVDFEEERYFSLFCETWAGMWCDEDYGLGVL